MKTVWWGLKRYQLDKTLALNCSSFACATDPKLTWKQKIMFLQIYCLLAKMTVPVLNSNSCKRIIISVIIIMAAKTLNTVICSSFITLLQYYTHTILLQ